MAAKKPSKKATKSPPKAPPKSPPKAARKPAPKLAAKQVVHAVPRKGGSTVWPPSPTAAAAAQRWALVTAKDIMRSNVVTVAYSAPLSEVERTLADNRISGAPVVDETGQIVGVVSVNDLVQRYAEDEDARPRRGHGFFHLSSEETLDEDFESFEVPEEAEETAQDVMTATVYTVPATAGLKEVAEAMCRHRVHRVLVQEEGRLEGLISTLDILEALRA